VSHIIAEYSDQYSSEASPSVPTQYVKNLMMPVFAHPCEQQFAMF